MNHCPSCGHALPSGARFCPGCAQPAGAASGVDPGATVAMGVSSSGRSSTGGGSRPAGQGNGDFAPGTLLAGRYRIVALLGRGGMGEVYRADDLTLGQSVALKFLPEAFSNDADRLARFYNEVRLAREVSHPNVCRVYDIGDLDGRAFLSMEFVDGEDLRSLLRRIGRLPQEKAVEISRQLCAGLAALHDREVLHRDLKPANVMVDGRGRVRITDFGLAGLAGTVKEAEIRSGTPTYMAPEQLSGESVSERSDLYALGLVLYEVFTGQAAFQADSMAELSRLQLESAPTSVTSLVADVDPAVERVISRCLDRDPSRRPASAIAVSTALPGGDPLAAALEAGETPSPELVAAAGGEGGIRPWVGALGIAAVLMAMLLQTALLGKDRIHRRVPVTKPAAVMLDRAGEIAAELGHGEGVGDRIGGYSTHGAVLRHVAATDDRVDRWKDLAARRPSGVLYWYRQSPGPLVAMNPLNRAGYRDPPLVTGGMLRMLLDHEGRLLELEAMPHEEEAPADSSFAPPWPRLFELAGLPLERFTPTESTWIPPLYSERRRAWLGTLPEAPETELRVEAGITAGRVSHFRLMGPWTEAERDVDDDDGPLFVVLLLLTVLGAGVFLAQRNVRSGRGDQRGALRLGIFVLLLMLTGWLLTTDYAGSAGTQMNIFFSNLGFALFLGALCWSLYLALEPIVRRIWPNTLIAWSRLLSGRLRDPLVGRALLVGAFFFLASTALELLVQEGHEALGIALPRPGGVTWGVLQGPRFALGAVLNTVWNATFSPLFFLIFLVLLRALVRRNLVTHLLFIVLITTIVALQTEHKGIGAAEGLMVSLLWLFTLTRFGLLPFMVGFFFDQLMDRFPLSLDFDTPYAQPAGFAMALVLLITVYGVATALAGRSFFGDGLERD